MSRSYESERAARDKLAGRLMEQQRKNGSVVPDSRKAYEQATRIAERANTKRRERLR